MPRAAIDFLNFRLDVLSEQAKHMATGIYEQSCGVTLRELRVLRLAYNEPGITQGEVSAQSFLEKTLVSKLVTALARRKLLTRQIGAEDARWVHLFLTDEGREVVKQCNRLGRKMEKSMVSVLTAAQIETFEICLAKMTARVELDAKTAQERFT